MTNQEMQKWLKRLPAEANITSMTIEVNRDCKNVKDAVATLMELRDEIGNITLDLIANGAKIEVSIQTHQHN